MLNLLGPIVSTALGVATLADETCYSLNRVNPSHYEISQCDAWIEYRQKEEELCLRSNDTSSCDAQIAESSSD